jgi:hypothetical protein
MGVVIVIKKWLGIKKARLCQAYHYGAARRELNQMFRKRQGRVPGSYPAGNNHSSFRRQSGKINEGV